MAWKSTIDECLSEVGCVDVIVEQRSDLNREIIMAVWEVIVSLKVRYSRIHIVEISCVNREQHRLG